MKDTIYREDAIRATWQEPTYTDPLNVLTEVRDRIEALPSAERPKGEWRIKDGVFYCSCCGNDSAFSEDDVCVYEVPLPNYCQDCGARMKGADDEVR